MGSRCLRVGLHRALAAFWMACGAPLGLQQRLIRLEGICDFDIGVLSLKIVFARKMSNNTLNEQVQQLQKTVTRLQVCILCLSRRCSVMRLLNRTSWTFMNSSMASLDLFGLCPS